MSMGAMSQVKETPVEGLKWKGNGADFLTINGLQNQLRRLTIANDEMTSENNVPTIPPNTTIANRSPFFFQPQPQSLTSRICLYQYTPLETILQYLFFCSILGNDFLL